MRVEGRPCAPTVRVNITAAVTHLCPFRTEVDHGTVRVSWSTSEGQTVELHSLAELLRQHSKVEISHEEWVACLADSIAANAQVADLVIVSTWRTGGLEVEVAHPDRLRPRPGVPD